MSIGRSHDLVENIDIVLLNHSNACLLVSGSCCCLCSRSPESPCRILESCNQHRGYRKSICGGIPWEPHWCFKCPQWGSWQTCRHNQGEATIWALIAGITIVMSNNAACTVEAPVYIRTFTAVSMDTIVRISWYKGWFKMVTLFRSHLLGLPLVETLYM